MILVDTPVWTDHPLVRLDLDLGSIATRENMLTDLAPLPQAPIAAAEELCSLIEIRRLFRRGIGTTDLQLVCSGLFDKSISIWTRDRRVGGVAEEFWPPRFASVERI